MVYEGYCWGMKTKGIANRSDMLIIGGGVIGLAISLALRERWPDQSVTLIEKEDSLGLHGSGRNSGVLHAGFYYSDDTLKSRLCRDGNRRLTEYCAQKGLRINRCGKLVVADNENELAGLDELMRRGKKNDVELELIDANRVSEIEPRARTFERAIFSPTTASVDPREVVASLARDARAAGVRLITGARYQRASGKGVSTSGGSFQAGYIINAAGLYADAIARDFGFSRDHRILPFKGVYLYGEETERLRTNIYPVPPLEYPFLGVHFTVGVDGTTKIGPTAIPAFWREQYSGADGFSVREFAEIAIREAEFFARNSFGFRTLAFKEIPKYRRSVLVSLARKLVPGISSSNYRRWGRPGIRAQLVNVRERKLVMDFKVEGDDKSFHVLNAVSPAFTSSLPFADFVVDSIAAERS